MNSRVSFSVSHSSLRERAREIPQGGITQDQDREVTQVFLNSAARRITTSQSTENKCFAVSSISEVLGNI